MKGIFETEKPATSADFFILYRPLPTTPRPIPLRTSSTCHSERSKESFLALSSSAQLAGNVLRRVTFWRPKKQPKRTYSTEFLQASAEQGAFGKRKSKETEMNSPACGGVNGVDFALTMSPDKSNFSKSFLPHEVRNSDRQDKTKRGARLTGGPLPLLHRRKLLICLLHLRCRCGLRLIPAPHLGLGKQLRLG